ncbi:hypothetical protein PtA15_12A104 [Puccinia triticina]|uniref:Uncharacterized protein n=1 Tax=Puccinia triticina TaxID=208348 RepID=A0ABY7CXT2_9BASI|nr:uncharacterized protein PtA15_12A104 [Puccinia triticina]WAQ90119.1 hypothetical protein PtA15_12A104 [Puccinia triticina]
MKLSTSMLIVLAVQLSCLYPGLSAAWGLKYWFSCFDRADSLPPTSPARPHVYPPSRPHSIPTHAYGQPGVHTGVSSSSVPTPPTQSAGYHPYAGYAGYPPSRPDSHPVHTQPQAGAGAAHAQNPADRWRRPNPQDQVYPPQPLDSNQKFGIYPLPASDPRYGDGKAQRGSNAELSLASHRYISSQRKDI